MYRLRKYDPQTDKICIVEMSYDDMVSNPTGLNMADVGILVLNRLRIAKGLEPIPVSSIADNIEEFERRGNDE